MIKRLTTALLVALAAQGCTAAPTNPVQSADPDPDQNQDGDPIRIKELNQNRDWLQFKAIWKNLDTISPHNPQGDEVPVFYYTWSSEEEPYRMSDSIGKLIKDLEPKLYGLVEKQLLDSAEVKLLVATVQARISYFFMGYLSMITRMMPPPGQVRKEGAIADLEIRIDALLKMKEQGKIETDELEPALENIYAEIRTFGYLDILTRSRRLGYDDELFFMTIPTKDTANLVQLSIDEFEKERADFLKKYKPERADDDQKLLFEAYERAHQELVAFQAILPKYSELVKDLVFND